LAASAAGPRGKQHRERAQPLAAVVDDVVCDLIDECDVAAEATDDRAVHVGPIVTDRGSKSVERRGGRQGIGEGHGNVNDTLRAEPTRRRSRARPRREALGRGAPVAFDRTRRNL
jgi:hypothetical protein